MRPPIAPGLYDRRDMVVRPRIAHADDAAPSLEDVGFTEAEIDAARDACAELLRTLPAWKRARIAVVIRRDGVEAVDRHVLAAHYRRHGVRELVRKINAAPLGRMVVVIDGEPEVHVRCVDANTWLAGLERECAGDDR